MSDEDLAMAGDRIAELEEALTLFAYVYDRRLLNPDDEEEGGEEIHRVTVLQQRMLWRMSPDPPGDQEPELTEKGLEWLRAVRADEAQDKAKQMAAVCTCGHTGTWHGSVAATPLNRAVPMGFGPCDNNGDCDCEQFHVAQPIGAHVVIESGDYAGYVGVIEEATGPAPYRVHLDGQGDAHVAVECDRVSGTR